MCYVEVLGVRIGGRCQCCFMCLSSEPPPPHQLPPTVSAIDSDNRAAFPLALGHTPCYVKPRMALVG